MKQFVIDIIRFLQYGDLSTKYYVKHGMIVGKNFNRQSGCKFDPSHCWLIKIGDNVTISNKVTILAHDDSMRNITGYGKINNVVIGNDVFIGANSTILCGVHIGNNTIIGANSLITKNIPENCVAAGNPCRVICSMNEFLSKHTKYIENANIFDLNWTIYSKKKLTLENKRKMFEMLEQKDGYIELGKYNNEK